MSATRPTATPLSALLRDLAAGFLQQMFFWGKDASHAEGNLFRRTGFEKRPSAGLQGTSCYSLPWREGRIELHGSHAGWFGPDRGFLFIRPLGRCVRWLDGVPPAPGEWSRDRYEPRADADLHAAARPFLDWWLEHERHVARLAGPGYRGTCYRHFRKLPKSRPWLPPADAIRWITALRNDPSALSRARRFTASAR